MMLSLAAVALVSWAYADFLAIPKPPSFPARSVQLGPIEPESIPPASSAGQADRQNGVETEAEDVDARPDESTFESPAPEAEILLYQGTDLSGTRWQHPDPEALRGFIDERNRRIAADMEPRTVARSRTRRGWFGRYR